MIEAVGVKERASLSLFLHRLGYTYLNLNALTIYEVNELVGAWNDEQKEKEKVARMARMKRGKR